MLLKMIFCLVISMVMIWPQYTYAQKLTTIRESATDKDITLTLDEGYFTGCQLILEFSVKTNTNHELINDNFFLKPDLKINGEFINQSNQVKVSKVDENYYEGIIEMNIPKEKELPEQFKGVFTTGEILNQKGNWSIDFEIKN